MAGGLGSVPGKAGKANKEGRHRLLWVTGLDDAARILSVPSLSLLDAHSLHARRIVSFLMWFNLLLWSVTFLS